MPPPPIGTLLGGRGPPKGREFGGRGLGPSGVVGPRPPPGLSRGFGGSCAEEQAGILRNPSVVRRGLKGRREVLGLTVRGPETGPLRAP